MNRSLMLKTLVIGALALALLVPVSMIRDLVKERQARRDEAVADIARGWGARQTLIGPYLVVPYARSVTKVVRETVDGAQRERRSERTESALLRLPAESLEWSISAPTSEKSRGIHTARLYTASIEANGSFAIPAQFGRASDAASRITWGTPRLVLMVSDPRGIRAISPLAFGAEKTQFAPGSGGTVAGIGLHAQLPGLRAENAARSIRFSFTLQLAGSEAFALAPVARDNAVELRSNWPHPSFQGAFLPARHEIKPDGFVAQWRVSQYAAQGAERLRNCVDATGCEALADQTLGVSFIEPVGLYQQLERAAKYGFLFIGLMFAAFSLFELLKRLAIHPIQYTLVGLALAIFFLLVTALSEHLPFWLAYVIATLACAGVITAYLARVLASRLAGTAFGAALAVLYGALYLLLRAEDYALLAGALLLFALLAATMLGTRTVDWYRLTQTHGRPRAESAPA